MSKTTHHKFLAEETKVICRHCTMCEDIESDEPGLYYIERHDDGCPLSPNNGVRRDVCESAMCWEANADA